MGQRHKRDTMAARSRVAAALIIWSPLGAGEIARLTSLPRKRVRTLVRLLRGEGAS
jgi:hypothetical protein